MNGFPKSLNQTMGNVIRAIISKVNDKLKMQEVQVKALEGEVLDEVEHFQPYGFTSHPHTDAEAILLACNGDRSHSIAIVVDDRRYRLQAMEQGEVALYTDEGDYIHFKRGNNIEMQTMHLKVLASEDVLIDTPKTKITGDVEIEGNVLVKKNITVLAEGEGSNESSFGGKVKAKDEIYSEADVKAKSISLVNHIHTGDNGGDTSPPKG